MTHAIRVHEYGGPEALHWEPFDAGQPGPGQVRLRQTAIGLNFIDVYHRTGLYKQSLPFVPGSEGAGVVEVVGAGVTEVQVGDRVGYAAVIGAYTESRLISADRLVPLPDSIDDRTAAAMLLQGLTAQYLLFQVYRVQPGDTILVHAAAGGVGLILAQWAAALGVEVIGTVSTDEKAELARANGCKHVVVYTREDFAARVLEITDGRKLPVVYDGTGRDTFMKSLDCLRPRALMVSYGQSSGAIPPLDVVTLSVKGSLYLTRPTLGTFTALRANLLSMADDLFDAVESGSVRIAVNQTYALRDVAQAHRDLEARKTTGSTVLLP
jgi:NADPH2:quinone reductase